MPAKEERAYAGGLSGRGTGSDSTNHRGGGPPCKSLMSQLTQKLDTALPGSLELDMSKVTFMDSSGIAVVLRTWKRMCQLGGSMRLQNVPSYAAKVLKAAGVDKLLEMTEKE